ncbi:MAG TPA: dTDP-4-dehydrorhamnose reductase [Stenotrophomonas sp.]
MTTLVFGGSGQVGQELLRTLAPLGRLLATTRRGVLADGTSCERADFDAPESLVALLDRLRPTRVVNAAAYTAVDRAEDERGSAFRANAESPAVIAQWCARHGAPLVHYSTDYVFDGKSSTPYSVDAPTAPLGVYGESKLAGEQAVRAADGRHLIFRTAWVYASHGHNFLRTMLRLGADRDELKVVADQIGTPTPAALIADVTARALGRENGLSGTWHLTAAGQTSWHGFAEEIFLQAAALDLIKRAPKVAAITTAEYPTPARRPAYSCLDTTTLAQDFRVILPPWQEGVTRVLTELQVAR